MLVNRCNVRGHLSDNYIRPNQQGKHLVFICTTTSDLYLKKVSMHDLHLGGVWIGLFQVVFGFRSSFLFLEVFGKDK